MVFRFRFLGCAMMVCGTPDVFALRERKASSSKALSSTTSPPEVVGRCGSLTSWSKPPSSKYISSSAAMGLASTRGDDGLLSFRPFQPSENLPICFIAGELSAVQSTLCGMVMLSVVLLFSLLPS